MEEGVLKRARVESDVPLEGDEELFIAPSVSSSPTPYCYHDEPVYIVFMRLDGKVYYSRDPVTVAQADAIDAMENPLWEARMRYMLGIGYDLDLMKVSVPDPGEFREVFEVLRDPVVFYTRLAPRSEDASVTQGLFISLGF